MAINDMVVQNMFLLTYNILQHKTCLKLGGKIHNKGTNLGRFMYLC